MKKRLITLLLAVIMVMTLLPMSAFAGIYDYDVTHPDETRYVLRGTQWLQSKDANGIFQKDVPANWFYDDGKTEVEVVNLETVNALSTKVMKKVVFAEPGSKFLVTAGRATGSQANFLVNDGQGTSKSIDFPIESQYGDLGNPFNELNYVPRGSVSATYGTDFVKGWRGNLLSRNGRLIEIKPDAVCDPDHPHVVKVKGIWGTANAYTGYLYIVITSRQDIINMVKKDTQTYGSNKPIYSVDLTCLGDSQRIPSEPSTVSGRDWWKFYPKGDKLNLAYDIAGSGNSDLNRYRVTTQDHHYANNADLAGLIKTDLFIKPEYGYTAAIDGTNTGGIADATGVKTKAVLNLTDADYQAMLDWLYDLAKVTKETGSPWIRDSEKNFDGHKGYYNKAGQDGLVDPNLKPLYTADHKLLANISATDIKKYEVIPYVVKLQTQKNIGWKIDCAIVPNAENRVQYIYDLNAPQGLTLDGVAAPSGDVALVNEALTAKIEAPTVSGTNMEAGNEYTFYDVNDNQIKVRFNGWTLDNASTPVYTPGQSKDLTSSTPKLYTFKGNWTVLNETVIVNKEVQGTDAEDVNFTFTFNFEDTQSHKAYVVDKYGLPVGLNEEDGSHPSSNLSNGSTMDLKAGQSIFIENVSVGTDVTVTEDSMPDNYSSQNPKVVITPDGQPEIINGYYVYEQSDKIVNDYGCYYIYHTATGETDKYKVSEFNTGKHENDSNLLDNVTPGYLYGGYYKDKECTKYYDVNGETSFSPKVGETYYLKEISEYYARISLYKFYNTGYASKPLTKLSLVTALDSNYPCKFILSDGEELVIGNDTGFASQIEITRNSEKYRTYSLFGEEGTKTMFSTLTDKIVNKEAIDPANGEKAVMTEADIPTNIADGMCVVVAYTTPDLVTVYGNLVAQITNKDGTQPNCSIKRVEGASYDKNGWHGLPATAVTAKSSNNPGDETGTTPAAKNLTAPSRSDVAPQAAKQLTRNMAADSVTNSDKTTSWNPPPVYESISLSESGNSHGKVVDVPELTPVENVPDVPETPDKPETPDVPETPDAPDVPGTPDTPATPDVPGTPDEPETPDKPETPDEPETADVTVKVNVNGEVKEIKGDKGDYTAKIEAPKQDGKVFAGWYTDEECTVPADLTNVKENVTLYAKFINASDVKVSTIKTSLLKNNFRTIVNADGEFVSASFVCKVNGKEITVNGIKKADGFVGDWSANTKLISKVTITPTFVTADGTTVYGCAKTFTYIFGLFI